MIKFNTRNVVVFRGNGFTLYTSRVTSLTHTLYCPFLKIIFHRFRGVRSVKIGAFSSPIGKARGRLKNNCIDRQTEAEAGLECAAAGGKVAGN